MSIGTEARGHRRNFRQLLWRKVSLLAVRPMGIAEFVDFDSSTVVLDL